MQAVASFSVCAVNVFSKFKVMWLQEDTHCLIEVLLSGWSIKAWFSFLRNKKVFIHDCLLSSFIGIMYFWGETNTSLVSQSLSELLTQRGFIFSFYLWKKGLVGFELFDETTKDITVDLWIKQIIIFEHFLSLEFLVSSFLLRLEKKRKHLKFQFLKFWLMGREWLQLLVQVALQVHQKLWLPPWAGIKVTAACVA